MRLVPPSRLDTGVGLRPTDPSPPAPPAPHDDRLELTRPPGMPEPLHHRRAPAPTSVLLIAAFGAFLAFLDSTIVNVAFPSIEASFRHTSISTLSWVLNAYNIVFGGFLVAAGRLADLLGRRRLFVAGVIIFTLASAGCSTATSPAELIAFRILQGLGAAVLVPASLALVIESVPGEHVTRAVTLWGASAALASGLGPPIGGFLVTNSTWRLAFLVNLPFGVAAWIVGHRGLVESRSPGERRQPDLLGASLLALGMSCLTLGLVKASDWGWANFRTVGAFVAGALLLTGFAVSNRVHPEPVLPLDLIRQQRFAVANVLTIVAGAGFYAYTLDHILWLNHVWGYTLLKAGLAVAPGALVAAVSAAVLGRVAETHGHRLVVAIGGVVWTVAFGYFYAHRVGIRPDFVGEWLPAQLVSGIGVGAVLPVLGSAAVFGVPGRRYATASAAVSATRQLGAVIGVSTLVAIIGAKQGLAAISALRDGWLFSAGCFAVVAIGAAALGRDVVDITDAAMGTSGRTSHEVGGEPAEALLTENTARGGANQSVYLDLSPEVVERLREAMHPVELTAGEWLFRAEDEANGLFFVDSGGLEVVIGDRVVSYLERGDVVGELALLIGGRRNASIRARRDTRLLHLTPRQFDEIAHAEPDVSLAIARVLATRLQRAQPSVLPARPARVIAVVACDPGIPIAEISSELVTRMGRWTRVVAPGRIGPDGLERAEREADRVVLIVGLDDDWRAFCLRTADRVVAVTTPGTSPPRDVKSRASAVDLVWLGDYPSRDRLMEWWDSVKPISSHVVRRLPAGEALQPLAARLATKSLGLVLAGGGARSLAHLGVIEELESAQIPIDRVAGTSAGAVIGAVLAAGCDAASIDAMVYEEFVRRNPHSDYTFPRYGLARGERTRAGLVRRLGDVLIEELPREFRCVSVDLLGRERVVHSRGRLTDAVMASLRLPGIFPPYRIGNALHVDGGIADNVPVDVLAERPEGPIVAVSVALGGPSDKASSPRMPGLLDTIMRSMLISSHQFAERSLEHADLVIRPRATGVGLLEWHQIDVMRESGRNAAREALPSIRRLVSTWEPSPPLQSRSSSNSYSPA